MIKNWLYAGIDRIGLAQLHRKRSVADQYVSERGTDEIVSPMSLIYVPEIAMIPHETAITLKDCFVTGKFRFGSAVKTKYECNNIVTGNYFAPREPRGNQVIVLIHGWRMDSMERLIDLVVRPFVQQGYCVYAPHLPYHYERQPQDSLYSGEFMISANISRTINAVMQAVIDIRSLIAGLRKQGASSIHLTGVSLGGQIANLAATYEPALDSLSSILYANNLAWSVWHTQAGIHIKKQLLGNGVTFGELDEAWRGLNPSLRKPLIPTDRILLMSARNDRYVDCRDADRLWEAWNRPPRIVYPFGHAGLVFSKQRISDGLTSFIQTLESEARG